jgi:hypothetical protein
MSVTPMALVSIIIVAAMIYLMSSFPIAASGFVARETIQLSNLTAVGQVFGQ